jgi:hypothetical protein
MVRLWIAALLDVGPQARHRAGPAARQADQGVRRQGFSLPPRRGHRAVDGRDRHVCGEVLGLTVEHVDPVRALVSVRHYATMQNRPASRAFIRTYYAIQRPPAGSPTAAECGSGSAFAEPGELCTDRITIPQVGSRISVPPCVSVGTRASSPGARQTFLAICGACKSEHRNQDVVHLARGADIKFTRLLVILDAKRDAGRPTVDDIVAFNPRQPPILGRRNEVRSDFDVRRIYVNRLPIVANAAAGLLIADCRQRSLPPRRAQGRAPNGFQRPTFLTTTSWRLVHVSGDSCVARVCPSGRCASAVW